MLNEKTFDTGEITLAYLENDSSNPPLVLLHGLTGWRSDWSHLLPLLTPDWHVYLLELRGHGNSGRGASYQLTDYDRDIIAFMRYLGEPVVLVGFSLGALVALTLASRYPEGIGSLVLIDPPLFAGISPMPNNQAAGNEYFTWVYEMMKATPSYETVREECAVRLPPDRDENVVKAMADQLYQVAPGTVETVLQGQLWSSDDLIPALQQVKPPTLMIQGDWAAGAAVRDEAVDLVKQHLPSATIIKIPNAGHLIPMEHPDIVLREMNALLSSI
jgi:pimeloyl-ACP methyl ester carboxylesterase